MLPQQQYLEIKIENPLHGTYCAIRDTIIYQAIKEKKKLKITIPQGVGMVDPSWWKNSGKVISKEFLIKGSPMILFANYVPIEVIEQSKLWN